MDIEKRIGSQLKRKEGLYFLWILLCFGFLSSMMTFPFTAGDEGFHFAKSYEMFSAQKPEQLMETHMRELELKAISNPKEISVKDLIFEPLEEVKKDRLQFNPLFDQNLTLRLDVGHLVPGLGILVGRMIYPSYGIMLWFARVFNACFFSLFLFGLLRKVEEDEFYTYMMIFSVPFMQKIASPSYDILAFIAIAAFGINFINLLKKEKWQDLGRKDLIWTAFTIVLILITKKNYIFALPSLLALPFVYRPLLSLLGKVFARYKMVAVLFCTLVLLLLSYKFHQIFNLKTVILAFFNNYFNLATMGGRGRTLFSIVQDNLPEMINILWIVGLTLVMLKGSKERYARGTLLVSTAIYFLNWLGIFLAFYLINNKALTFDDLTGRYLHAYLVFLIPLVSQLGSLMEFSISRKSLKFVAFSSTILVLGLYLCFTFYRGYVLGVTPAWSN